MQIPESHGDRIANLVSRLDETANRLLTRLQRAGERAEQATGGWSPAQIGFHVSLVNENLASMIDGTLPGATAPAADFAERPWSEVVSQVPARNESPTRFVPPERVSPREAIDRLCASAAHLRKALTALTPERGCFCITNRVVGTISLYQAGEFAIAHMIRHNQQAKRILGEP